jgi:ribosomal protein S18 acetylase RimI-like enzyme
VHIRKATPADAAAVRNIVEQVYVGEGWADPQRSPDYVRSLLDAEGRIGAATVLLSEVEGRAVATLTAVQQPPLANIAQPGELEVRMLAVLPDARRTGAARALMHACEDLARERGLSRIVLSTESAMTAAQGLYASLGYTRTPHRDWSIDGFPLITYAKEFPGG